MSEWFNDARILDQVCYDHKLADYPRGLNRARIDALFNGAPPYSTAEVEENGINVNVNFLEATRLGHDSRMQFMQGFVKPGKYFTAQTDYGPKHKRQRFSEIVNRHANLTIKKSPRYFEVLRGQFAQLVLHGVSPAVWENSYRWCPRVMNIEDALVPSGTLVGFENLPHVIFYRSFTGMELQRLTCGPLRDPGWNMPYVKRLLEWVDSEGTRLMNTNWPEVWSPEKQQERLKGDSGFYASDQLPTIDCFDIYVYRETAKTCGWVRRIILDAWGEPASSGTGYSMNRRADIPGLEKPGASDFVFNSEGRYVAQELSEISNFQFGDLSAVAPFRYHSVRSLGWLMYAVCHLQNRMRCRFTESVFEALLMYFRIKTGDDSQRALKVNLISKGFIDDTLQFVPAADRFQVNAALVELGLGENARLIQSNAGSFTPTTDFKDRTEKTKFQVMAELNVTTSLVSAALMQAYQYKSFEYEEIFRRFCKKNSKDAQVRDFQAACVRDGLPVKMLCEEYWSLEPERVMGSGNKTMELAIVEQLMQWRNLYDPSAQREILRMSTSALTDPALADTLVPEQPQVSGSVHDAQLTASALMQGLPVALKSGINQTEYIAAMMASMAVVIQRIMKQQKGVANLEQLTGLSAMQGNIVEHLNILAEDPEEAATVRKFNDQLGQLMNIVKGFAQRFLEQEKAKNGQSQMDPETMGKIQAMTIQAEAKAQNARESHAQKTAQREITFEKDQQRRDAETAAEIQRENARTQQELAHEGARTSQELLSEGAKTVQQIQMERRKAKASEQSPTRSE